MPGSSLCKFVVAVLMSGPTLIAQAQAQAQEIDSRWRLSVADLKHEVKVEATIRFLEAPAAESCMGGRWKRVVVEEKTAYDEKFFPLAEPLAYQLEAGELTLGRVAVCDGYLFLSGKTNGSTIEGIYDAVSLGAGRKLGNFILTRMQ